MYFIVSKIHTMDERWKQDAKWQKPDVNGSIYMNCPENANLETQKADQSASGANMGTGIKHQGTGFQWGDGIQF